FARRAQHQRLNGKALYLQLRKQADRKSCSLAATGFCLSNNIPTAQNQRQALRLNGSHFLITETFKVIQHFGSKGQRGKSSRNHGKLIESGKATAAGVTRYHDRGLRFESAALPCAATPEVNAVNYNRVLLIN